MVPSAPPELIPHLAYFMATVLVELPLALLENNPWGGTCLRGPCGNWSPHVQLAIYQFPKNVQRVLALADIGAECTLIYGKPEKFLEDP